MLVYFKPDPGMAPVVLEALGTARIFHPRDAVWKKVDVQKDTVKLRDPYDPKEFLKGDDGKPVYRKNLVKTWVVDKEKTALLQEGKLPLPPDFFEMTEDEWRILNSGRNTKIAKYFVKAEKVDADNKKAFDTIQKEHEAQLAELRKKMEIEKREMEEQLAEMKRQTAAAMKKLEQNSAVESRLPKR